VVKIDAPLLRWIRAGTGAFQDALFLTSITVLSFAWYVRDLGFYLDDYSFMRVLGQARSHSLSGLYSALSAGAPKAQMRPVQIATLAALYRFFGPHPHAYHIFNGAVLVGGVLLLYLVLRELGQTRLISVGAAVLYATVPHFSTDRFWVAAFQANVSMTLYFLSQYAALRALRADGRRWWGWAVLALVTAVGSVLAYEVALPLFLLTPLLLIWYARRLPSREAGFTRGRPRLLLGFSLLSLGAAVAAKIVVAVRVGHESSYQLGVEGGLAHHLAYLVSGSLKVNVGSYGFGLPYIVVWIATHQLKPVVAILSLIAGMAVFLYLWHLARRQESELPSATDAKRLIAAGIVVFIFGYAVFVTNNEIFFTSAGVDNRVNIAAAAGVVLVLVGLVAWIGAVLPRRLRRAGFALCLSLLATTGFFIVNSLASFWIQAARKQDKVIAEVQTRLPAGRAGHGTLLVDGLCPEVGPAIVFTTQYDITGALFLRLKDPGLTAAVVSPFVRLAQRSLSISNYFNGHRTSQRSYPYGRSTFVYNYETKRLYRLADARSTRHYFRRLRAPLECPAVRSFIWDIPTKWHRFTA
jgi:hypothetical protein